MTELETNLRTILQEKTTKLIPENIKKDITVMGVTGTLEGEVNNQDKTVTSNGAYTADSGYSGLGTVTVNVDFESFQEYTECKNLTASIISGENE